MEELVDPAECPVIQIFPKNQADLIGQGEVTWCLRPGSSGDQVFYHKKKKFHHYIARQFPKLKPAESPGIF